MPSTGRANRPPESARRGEAQRHEPSRRHEREPASSPLSLMRQGLDEMDRWFGRWGMDRGWRSPGSWMSPTSWMGAASDADWSPAIEAFQRGSEFVVRAEVPGMNRTDLHVEAGDDTLTIRGERKHEQQEEREGVFWSERSYGSFCRVIPLPPGAISESAKASFNNGVLEVVMETPSQDARRGRRIDISGQPETR